MFRFPSATSFKKLGDEKPAIREKYRYENCGLVVLRNEIIARRYAR